MGHVLCRTTGLIVFNIENLKKYLIFVVNEHCLSWILMNNQDEITVQVTDIVVRIEKVC